MAVNAPPQVRERTRNFPRRAAVDCRRWLEFEIVAETARYRRIRYVEFDTPPPPALEYPASGPPPGPNPNGT